MNRLILGLISLTAMLSASVEIAPIPEPSTYLMMGAGLGALIYVRSRMAKKK